MGLYVTHQLELFQEINITYISKINSWTQTEQRIFLYKGPFHFLFKYLRYLICTQGKKNRRSKGLQNTGFRSAGDACFLPFNSSLLSFNLSRHKAGEIWPQRLNLVWYCKSYRINSSSYVTFSLENLWHS